jgi:predicted helicase
MESGLINKEDLTFKYQNEIHANEIVLLAYYIAAVNIEAVYQDLVKENQYEAFNGIVLTDTFQLYEQERDMIANLLPDNSNRRTRQKETDITVLIGNPPYSSGQRSENDAAENIVYPNLDQRISSTYISNSSNKMGKSKAYDSYIRAFRWASDRIGKEGVIGFVSGAGWIDGNATDGLRKSFAEEFTKIYVFHLRGNQRTSGELSRKEGGKIFGSGSRSPIAITLLVKNKEVQEKGKIYFYDIGDYLDREQKLAIIQNFKSINGIKAENKFSLLEPDEKQSWINQGDEAFSRFIVVSDKQDKEQQKIFETHSIGILSNRDNWVFNFSNYKLASNISNAINVYNKELIRLNGNSKEKLKEKVVKDKKLFSWTDDVISDMYKGNVYEFENTRIVTANYRPFTSCKWYRDKRLNWSFHLMDKIFPDTSINNFAIIVSGVGGRGVFSAFMVNRISEKQIIDNGQCLPLKVFQQEGKDSLFYDPNIGSGVSVQDGITDQGYNYFLEKYSGKHFTKEDLFYYVYGILHSPDYRQRFKNNLSIELPRIPLVKRFEEFNSFSKAGRKLGDLHVNYESVEPYSVVIKEGDLRLAQIPDPKEYYRVEKMKFPNKKDKKTVFYNKNITMQNIPTTAYEYVVNGRSALEWVMDRQCVKTDKASGIVNDANDYANETMNNPAYPLELFQRVITVSLETMKIVRSLPKLDID